MAPTSTPEPKPCTVCGREITWRKKWERDWEQIRYCSKKCRAMPLSDLDQALEAAIVGLLEARSASSSICPSDAARRVDPEGWRSHMEAARSAARRLVNAGRVEITQKGRAVEPSGAKGPIRIRLVRSPGLR